MLPLPPKHVAQQHALMTVPLVALAGTQLKVATRKRVGKVAEIRLVEVGSALDSA